MLSQKMVICALLICSEVMALKQCAADITDRLSLYELGLKNPVAYL